jgi:hypothetical protein
MCECINDPKARWDVTPRIDLLPITLHDTETRMTMRTLPPGRKLDTSSPRTAWLGVRWWVVGVRVSLGYMVYNEIMHGTMISVSAVSAWCKVRGAWCVVRGAWCMVHVVVWCSVM